MIHFTFPMNSDNKAVVFEVSPTGKQPWVDYIPCFNVASGTARVHDDDGFIPVQILNDVTGLQEWVDYTPVDFVTESQVDQWTTNEDGYIPVDDS